MIDQMTRSSKLAALLFVIIKVSVLLTRQRIHGETYKLTEVRAARQWNDLPDTVQSVAARLKEAQIENTDAIMLIERYNHPQTLIYIDPPYLTELRKPYMYKHEMTDNDHVKLLETIRKSKSMVILSGYDNKLYNETLSDWYSDTCTSHAQTGQLRTEKIWMNFPYQYSLF